MHGLQVARKQQISRRTPKTGPTYENDIPHKCKFCDGWHLSRPAWLSPNWLDLDSGTAVKN